MKYADVRLGTADKKKLSQFLPRVKLMTLYNVQYTIMKKLINARKKLNHHGFFVTNEAV